LHTIRSMLSRPSEGLVSNYNLTIFLLASEVRPLAHLLKMVQARTLYLQRVVASSVSNGGRVDRDRFLDLAKRLEELEAHVAEAANSLGSPPSPGERESAKNVVADATSEARKALHPEIDALNRAMRRYEKRATVMAVQIDTRFRELETQVHDAVALATMNRRHRVAIFLVNWIYAVAVLPGQALITVTTLPVRLASYCLQNLRSLLVTRRKPVKRSNQGKQPENGRSHSQKRSRQGSIPPSPEQSARGLKKAM
jgi:hypothetical protein